MREMGALEIAKIFTPIRKNAALPADRLGPTGSQRAPDGKHFKLACDDYIDLRRTPAIILRTCATSSPAKPRGFQAHAACCAGRYQLSGSLTHTDLPGVLADAHPRRIKTGALCTSNSPRVPTSRALLLTPAKSVTPNAAASLADRSRRAHSSTNVPW